MSTTINIHDLAARLEEVRRLSGGDEITVTDGNDADARVLPLTDSGPDRPEPFG